MKRAFALVALAVASIGAAWAALRSPDPAPPPLTRYVPAGSMLCLQAKDLAGLLSVWNGSQEKKQWIASSNYHQFSNSRLFLRLREASDQFAAAAGLPPDMKFLNDVAGKQSAVALYDIGNLHFLYITRLSSDNSMQSALWRTRLKFETRALGNVTFYVRRDPQSERTVAFAATGDYLLFATREDLLADALQLLADGKGRSIEAEEWWAKSVSATGPQGDLRLVLNLEKIVPSPYFRSYWIQKNITDMKQYSAAVTDLFRSGREYREERVLIRKAAPAENASAPVGASAVAELRRLIPADAGIYRVRANPLADYCLDLLETKLLAPHLGPAPAVEVASQVQLTSGTTGSSSDLETRIDEPPTVKIATSSGTGAAKDLFVKNLVRAALQVQSSVPDKDGVFVRIHSALVFLGDSDWKENDVRSTLREFLGPQFTAGQLGLDWQPKNGFQQLSGLWSLDVAMRGKYLLISDDSALLGAIVETLIEKAPTKAFTDKPAVLVTGFNHLRERANFKHLSDLLDGRTPGAAQAPSSSPCFFADNLSSISSTLSTVSAEKIVERDAGDKVFETVTYEWSH